MPSGATLARVAVPLAVNAFQGVMIAIFAGFLAMILALGKWSTRSAAEYLDWKPTRSPGVDARNEVDDIEQMLAAQNRLRRRRGAPERSRADVDADVRRAQAEREALDRHHGSEERWPAS